MKRALAAVLPWAPTALAALLFLVWILRFDLFEALLAPMDSMPPGVVTRLITKLFMKIP